MDKNVKTPKSVIDDKQRCQVREGSQRDKTPNIGLLPTFSIVSRDSLTQNKTTHRVGFLLEPIVVSTKGKKNESLEEIKLK